MFKETAKDRYSLSRAIVGLIDDGTARGIEMEWSAQLERGVSPKLQDMRGNIGTLVPSSAFNTRAVTSGGSGGALVGTKVQQLSGILGWSAVVNSGAQLLGPLTDSDVRVYHDQNLPAASWQTEIGAVVPADVNFASSTLSARRIAAQIIVSRQLLIQSTGALPLDEFLAYKMKVAFASVLDQSALYGTGPGNNQPLGVISTPGTNSVTTTVPPSWGDLTNMRFLTTNADIDRSSFGWITSPQGRKYFESTTRFTNAAASFWDLMQKESEISLEVNDNRIFAGLWNYLAIGFWLGDANGPAADIVTDVYTRAELGEVVITGSAYVDLAVRWPQLFAYSQPSIFP
jgi:hypothetical protein